MTELKFETIDGSKYRIWWPSMGLLRTWALMVILQLATPTPLVGPSFLACWAIVSIARLVYHLIKDM